MPGSTLCCAHLAQRHAKESLGHHVALGIVGGHGGEHLRIALLFAALERAFRASQASIVRVAMLVKLFLHPSKTIHRFVAAVGRRARLATEIERFDHRIGIGRAPRDGRTVGVGRVRALPQLRQDRAEQHLHPTTDLALRRPGPHRRRHGVERLLGVLVIQRVGERGRASQLISGGQRARPVGRQIGTILATSNDSSDLA